MKSAILMTLLLAPAVGCGSPGEGNASTVPPPASTGQAPGNPDQPLGNADTPGNEGQQPLENPDQPLLNSEQAASSGGPSAGAANCAALCALVESRCASDCARQCGRLVAVGGTCPSEVSAVLACAQLFGIGCNENDHISTGDACDGAGQALEDCIDLHTVQTPRPSDTGSQGGGFPPDAGP